MIKFYCANKKQTHFKMPSKMSRTNLIYNKWQLKYHNENAFTGDLLTYLIITLFLVRAISNVEEVHILCIDISQRLFTNIIIHKKYFQTHSNSYICIYSKTCTLKCPQESGDR